MNPMETKDPQEDLPNFRAEEDTENEDDKSSENMIEEEDDIEPEGTNEKQQQKKLDLIASTYEHRDKHKVFYKLK